MSNSAVVVEGRLPVMYCDVLTVNTAMSFRTWAVVFMVPMALSQVREDGMFVADFAETWHLYAFIYSEIKYNKSCTCLINKMLCKAS